MAVLTDADYAQLRGTLYQLGSGKEELKGPQGTTPLPNKVQLKAMFQALETRTTNAFANYKNDIDTNIGVVTSNALAKKILAAYFAWKLSNL